MSQTPNIGSLVGKWTYRSFLCNPDLSVDFNSLESVPGSRSGKGRSNERRNPALPRLRFS